ncbi:MAG TPA: type II secretion system F family protein [Actinomycetales bacterium]|nr:type II secretion system F family protein [Actinomycetales bacterium]
MAALIALGALCCYALAVKGYRMVKAQPQTSLGPADVDVADRPRTLLPRLLRRLDAAFGPPLLAMLGPGWKARVRRRLEIAGSPGGMTVSDFAGRQATYAVAGLVVFGFFTLQGSPISGLIGVLVAAMPEVQLASQIKKRQRAIESELPDFLDLLAVTVSAGVSFRPAIGRVARTTTGALGEETELTLRQLDYGVSRREAFAALRDRNPGSDTMAMFVTAILQAEELGAPLTETLQQLAGDMRREFAQDARRRAARAAPRVSLIITMIMVPAVVLLVVVALYLGSGVQLGDL